MRDTVSVAAVRWSLSIIFVICLSATLLVSIQGRQNDERLERALATQQSVIVQVDANTKQLKTTVHNLCVASNTAATGTNEVLQSLINAVTITKSLPTTEKVDRIKKYRAVMVPLLKCPL